MHSHSEKEETLVTKVIDVPPSSVKNELDIYSLFGWDFKHRKTYRRYAGFDFYKNGNRKDINEDVVQITLQRDVKASWCTEELLIKEKEFFDLRKRYEQEDKDYDAKQLFMGISNDKSREVAPVRNSTLQTVFVLLMVIFFFLGILSFALVPIPNWVGYIMFGIAAGLLVTLLVFARQQYNITKEQKEKAAAKTAELRKKAEQTHIAKQKDILTKMSDIAIWAGKHMKAKFGYEIHPSFVENINE